MASLILLEKPFHAIRSFIFASSVWSLFLLQIEFTRTKDIIAWNAFTKRIDDAIITNKLKGIIVNDIKNTTYNDFETIWIKIPFLADKEDQLLKAILQKKATQFTQKLRFYTNKKDQIPKLMTRYQFNSLSCNDS